MEAAIVVVMLTGTKNHIKPIKKMLVVNKNEVGRDDYSILCGMEEQLAKEFQVKDIRKAGYKIHASIADVIDGVNPNDSATDICTDVLLDEYFTNHLYK